MYITYVNSSLDEAQRNPGSGALNSWIRLYSIQATGNLVTGLNEVAL